jgi:hypothetical protein
MKIEGKVENIKDFWDKGKSNNDSNGLLHIKEQN